MANLDKALVTGAGGFIGSHLVETLLRRGVPVRAFLRYTSHATLGGLEELAPELKSSLEIFYGDVRDPRAVRQAADGCQTLYHLAALIGIPYSYVAPGSYVDVNIGGTLNVLETARDLEIARTVITSTSEVYGTARYTPIDEEHPLQGQSPYAATKIGADQLALSYHRAFGLPVTIVRPFNTYGPRQSSRAVIPTIMSQALTRDRIVLGNLSPVRDLVYVRDTAEGFVAAAASEACVGEVTHLATGVGVSIGELVAMILRLTGKDLPVETTAERVRPDSSEVFELLGTSESATRRAGWSAATSLEDGLESTLHWVESHLDRFAEGEYRV